MGNIAESLKENLDAILKELPEELHDAAKKEVEEAGEITALTGDEELEAIKKELADNPDVDESAVGDVDPAAHQPPPLPSEEEQKAEMEAALKDPPQGEPQDDPAGEEE